MMIIEDDRAMPLQPVNARPWIDGSGVRFPMKNGISEVRCVVQQGALDFVEQTTVEDMQVQLDRFERHRTLFEAVASDLYDAGLPLRITVDHVIKLRKV